MWRRHLTAWRALLHQKLHLFQVSHGEGWHMINEHIVLSCHHIVIPWLDSGVLTKRVLSLCLLGLGDECCVSMLQAFATLQNNLACRCVHYWKAWVDKKADWRSFQARATQHLTVVRWVALNAASLWIPLI